MIKFSPGVIQSCRELIDLLDENLLTLFDVRTSFHTIGRLPIDLVIETAEALRWVSTNNSGCLVPTNTGKKRLAETSYEIFLRCALLDYIEIERPPWIHNAVHGRLKVVSFAGSQIEQIFVEAGLVEALDDDTVAFWDELAAKARGLKNDKLNDIGRAGERLSMQFELLRTGVLPRWIAVDNNSDGYDVLSVVDCNDSRRLSIEVKTSTLGLRGSIHITRNEWAFASMAEVHLFHVWDTTQVRPRLAVVYPNQVATHVPTNKGNGSWESVEIPIESFASSFCEVDLATKFESGIQR